MKITICRKAHFNAAHKLYNPALSNDENFEIFGKCSYENFHGHNYELIVKILGDIDPKTGMVMDLSDLKKIIKTDTYWIQLRTSTVGKILFTKFF